MHLTTGDILTVDKVLLATGRPPNLEPLQLNNTGIKVEKNAIKVDEYSNTTAPGIYAIGDVIDKVNLTPAAIRAGRILSERIFNNR